jgi:hypothetical protein
MKGLAGMKAARIEKWVWVLIYGGLLTAGLGLSVQRMDDVLGWSLVGGGGIACSLGVVLILVRSRMKNHG